MKSIVVPSYLYCMSSSSAEYSSCDGSGYILPVS